MFENAEEDEHARDEEIKYFVDNCEEFCRFLLKGSATTKLNRHWLSKTIGIMVHDHMDRLSSIPSLHKCAVLLDQLEVNSRLFAVFAGHYLSHEYDFKKFIAFQCDNQHTRCVFMLKRLEYIWDLIELDDNFNSLYYDKLACKVYPLTGENNLFDEVREITDKLLDEGCLIAYGSRFISPLEYSIARISNLDSDCISRVESDLVSLIKDYILIKTSAENFRLIETLYKENIKEDNEEDEDDH